MFTGSPDSLARCYSGDRWSCVWELLGLGEQPLEKAVKRSESSIRGQATVMRSR